MSAFAQMEIFYSNTVCNKSAAEACLYLVTFYGNEWWSKRFYFDMYFAQNNYVLH